MELDSTSNPSVTERRSARAQRVAMKEEERNGMSWLWMTACFVVLLVMAIA
ncbi:MAG: hypothetical protein ACM3X5_09035 [Bacillota bacterium]